MSIKEYDLIVVGSGPAGAHVALPLVEAGISVAMIDGGITAENSGKHAGNFEEIRKNDWKQRSLFLGSNLQSIVSSGTHSKSMTGGSREYVVDKTDEFLPIKESQVSVMQSLAKGGLSEAWGASCDILKDDELRSMGIPLDKMAECYQQVINSIGVSGEKDNFKLLPPSDLDFNAKQIISRYATLKNSNKNKFILSKSILALLTKELGTRKPVAYRDMEYWLNEEESIYRSRFTIESLQKRNNFSYLPGKVVIKLHKIKDKITLDCKDLVTKNTFTVRAKKVILAAGSINTIRILLNSFSPREAIPVLIKPHVLIPCLNFGALGNAGPINRHSLCQLFIRDVQNKNGVDRSFTQIYSYKSLLLYKLLGFSPLSAPESLSLLAKFTPSLIIADVRFPTFPTPKVNVRLSEKNTLVVHAGDGFDKQYDYQALKEIKRFLRRLKLFPLKTVFNPLGSTAHYAGGAYSSESNTCTFATKEDGSLWRDESIYIADASTWNVLSPKPPALTIMANARRIGLGLALKMAKKSKISK